MRALSMARTAGTTALLFLLVCGGVARGGERLERVRLTLPAARAAAAALERDGFDVLEGTITDSSVELVVGAADRVRLSSLGFLPVTLERGRPFREIQGEQGVPGGYLDLTGIVDSMTATALAYPQIAQLVDVTAAHGLPPTEGGRHLYALKLSDNVASDEDEPAYLLVGCHHAREIVTPVLALDAIARLTSSYGIDPALTALVDEYEIWIAPVWNPDGYAHVFDVDNMWRKNRRVFPGGTGVDLNRNYPFGWTASCSGSSNVTSGTYKGPGPGSETETVSMMAFSAARRFAKVLDYHSSGREALSSYLCLTHPWTSYLRTEAIALSTASGYGGDARDPSAEGEHYEWQLASFGSHSFLVETATSFQPPYSSAQAEADLVWPGTRWLLERPISVWGHVTDACTGQPLLASVSFPAASFVNGETNASFLPFGRYHAFPPPGTHTIEFAAPSYITESRSADVTVTGSLVLDVALSPAAGCAACQPGSLTRLDPLLVAKAGLLGASFTWPAASPARAYHLNSVASRLDLVGDGPKLPPVGRGRLECDTPTLGCIDADAIADPATLLFYQVLGACGTTGAEEGPV